MPEAFKNKFESPRVIIDCTEVRCQMPSSLQLSGELFSSYKHYTTIDLHFLKTIRRLFHFLSIWEQLSYVISK